ncbi:MAG: hypothetical protein JWO50_862 [Candidatus Kaiserbacteria bacterium]|nr:hypothetical protein [Candidatus Kaiserbacteria bacterium]
MREGLYLTLHRTIVRTALAGAHIFAWIFIFEYFFILSESWQSALLHVTYAYALTHLTTLLATPYGGIYLGNSLKRAIALGVVANALAFIILGSVFVGTWGGLTGLGISLFAILFGLYRALYWVPYVVEHRYAGEQPQYVERELLLALLPAGAGVLLAQSILTPSTLLYGAGVIVLVSSLPLIAIRDRVEKFEWAYVETFTRLLSRKNHHLATQSMLLGVENTAILLLWPICLLLIAGGSHMLFGILLTITMLVVLILKIPRASSYITHTHATDGGHYIDEYTALREMSESAGRILLCCVVIVSIYYVSLVGALFVGFLCAAFAATIRSFSR